MKRFASIAGGLLGLLALGVLLVALVLTLHGLPRDIEPASQVFQSPIITPTQPPYPPPATSTPPRTPTAVPTASTTVTPPTPSTPTAVPTASGPLPPGPKVAYAETALDGTVTFWAASAVNPERRRMLTTADPARFGVNAALSHDGSWIAYTFTPTNDRFAAELWVVRLNGTERKQLATGIDVGRYVNYPIWSPDNRYVAVIRQKFETSPQLSPFPYTQTISIINIGTGQEIPLVEAHVPSIGEEASRNIFPLDWSSDSRFLYYRLGAVNHVELWRVDVKTYVREYVNTISEQGAPRCYFLSPNDRWLLCTVLETRDPPQYAVTLVPTEPRGQIEVLISGARDALYNPIWYPDGQEVTIVLPPQANEQAKLQAINVRTRATRTIAVAEAGVLVPRMWSSDGRWLAVQRYPETYRNLFILSSDGTQTRQIYTTGSVKMIGWLTDDLFGESR